MIVGSGSRTLVFYVVTVDINPETEDREWSLGLRDRHRLRVAGVACSAGRRSSGHSAATAFIARSVLTAHRQERDARPPPVF